MTSASDRPDSGLDERLRELDAAETSENGEMLEQMFSNMKARCDKSDRTLGGLFGNLGKLGATGPWRKLLREYTAPFVERRTKKRSGPGSKNAA